MEAEASRDGSRDGPWFTVAEAARRLRVSPRAIRGRIKRGTIEWKAAGNAGKLVRLPSGDVSPDDPGDDQEDELDLLREELAEARIAQARAEVEAQAARDTVGARVAVARAEVAAKEEIIADLREQVAWLRRSWWRRWRGG